MDERICEMRREDERGYTLPRCRLGSDSQGAEEVSVCRCKHDEPPPNLVYIGACMLPDSLNQSEQHYVNEESQLPPPIIITSIQSVCFKNLQRNIRKCL